MQPNLTCLSSYPSIPSIPFLSNLSNHYNHSPYRLNENSIIEKISSSILDSSLSLYDIELLLKLFLKSNQNSFSLSSIFQTNLISSIIIYTIISLILVLIFSLSSGVFFVFTVIINF